MSAFLKVSLHLNFYSLIYIISIKNAAHKVIGVLGILLLTTAATLAQENKDRKEHKHYH